MIYNHVTVEEVMGENRIIIEDNELYQNNMTGIRIRGNIPALIKGCKIYSNGRAGMAIGRHSQVVINNSDIFQNQLAGINIYEAADVTIEDSRIYKNKRAGIRTPYREIGAEGKSGGILKVKILNSKIYNNSKAGIITMPRPDMEVDLTLLGNHIYQNKRAGLRIENNTRLIAKGNYIYDNAESGITAYISQVPSTLDIYQNVITGNGLAGIYAYQGIAGPIGIKNNLIFNNYRSGIMCGLSGKPDSRFLNLKIINNTIVSNYGGIRDESKGKLTIMNNIFAYNYISGIIPGKCGHGYSHNLFFANSDTTNLYEDCRSSTPFNERRQVGGCLRGKGDLICDPLFADPDKYDFSLQDTSPAIDAGRDREIYNDRYFPPSKGTEKNDIGVTGGPYAYYPGYISSPTPLTSRLEKNPIVLQGHAEGRL